jgi:hypothetical protein
VLEGLLPVRQSEDWRVMLLEQIKIVMQKKWLLRTKKADPNE